MLRIVLSRIVVMATVAAALLLSSATASAQQARVRSLQYSPEKPIADRLLPDDEIVELVFNADVAVFERQPTPQQMLRIAIGDALDVAVVDVEVAQAELVDNGTAISTVFKGTVREVLKVSKQFSLRESDQVTVVLGGGEVRIGKTIVRTTGDLRQRPPVGRYVMFMSERALYPDARSVTFAPMLLRDNVVSPVTVDDLAALLRGTSLASIKEEARRQSRVAKK